MNNESSSLEQQPLVSVIVPVYNVEQYLDECVEHLIGQSFENIEIVLVDDGSTDSSGTKCDDWSEKDKRILVVHQSNQGLSMARNNGLGASSGSYITYVDSDDYCTDDYVEKLVGAITANGADVCLCSYNRVDTRAQTCDTRHIPAIQSGNLEELTARIVCDDFPPCAWAKMYTRDFAEQAYFDKGALFEDTRMWSRIVSEIDDLTFCSIDEPLYQYRTSNSSSIMASFHADRERGIVEAWGGMCDAATQRFGTKVEPHAKFRRAWMRFEVLDRAIFNGEEANQDYCDEAVRYLREHAQDVYESDYFSNNRKRAMRALSVSKALYAAIRRRTME
ncbi:MAG: glycosyltransferase family 2 protein [Eggerthellaceae bacterium]|nr:glycosyltransferase family 2 protein [Eggerthellaceae bacterium]